MLCLSRKRLASRQSRHQDAEYTVTSITSIINAARRGAVATPMAAWLAVTSRLDRLRCGVAAGAKETLEKSAAFIGEDAGGDFGFLVELRGGDHGGERAAGPAV